MVDHAFPMMPTLGEGEIAVIGLCPNAGSGAKDFIADSSTGATAVFPTVNFGVFFFMIDQKKRASTNATNSQGRQNNHSRVFHAVTAL